MSSLICTVTFRVISVIFESQLVDENERERERERNFNSFFFGLKMLEFMICQQINSEKKFSVQIFNFEIN